MNEFQEKILFEYNRKKYLCTNFGSFCQQAQLTEEQAFKWLRSKGIRFLILPHIWKDKNGNERVSNSMDEIILYKMLN